MRSLVARKWVLEHSSTPRLLETRRKCMGNTSVLVESKRKAISSYRWKGRECKTSSGWVCVVGTTAVLMDGVKNETLNILKAAVPQVQSILNDYFLQIL